MATIELTHGKIAIVDDEDFDWLAQLSWAHHSGHATTGVNGVHMAKLILQVGTETKVMYRNDNPLDNRRANLLPGSVSNKCQKNHKAKTPKSSRYKGVSWRKDRKVWTAHIQLNGRLKYLGYFKWEKDAALAYDDAAREHFGQFARTNF